jgi:hypothetical protein
MPIPRNAISDKPKMSKHQDRDRSQKIDNMNCVGKRTGVSKSEPRRQGNTGLPTDVVLLILLLAAYALNFLGLHVWGGAIAFCTLVYYMICLNRERRPFLYHYPYRYNGKSNSVAIIAGAGLLLGGFLSRNSPVFAFIAATSLGVMLYYVACVNLYTRTAMGRYGSSIRRAERPVLFWFLTIVVGLLGLLYVLSPFWACALMDMKGIK